MNPDHSIRENMYGKHVNELIELLKKHDVHSHVIDQFIRKHHGTEYFGEIQSVLDVKELLDAGLIP